MTKGDKPAPVAATSPGFLGIYTVGMRMPFSNTATKWRGADSEHVVAVGAVGSLGGRCL